MTASNGQNGQNGQNGAPKMGRPTKWTPEVEEDIRKSLVIGMSLKTAAAAGGITQGTLLQWRKNDPDFSSRCEKAIAQGKSAMIAKLVTRANAGSDKCLIEWCQKRTEEFRNRKLDDARTVPVPGMVEMKTLTDCRDNANLVTKMLATGKMPMTQASMMLNSISETREAIRSDQTIGDMEEFAEHMEVIRKAMAPREVAESRINGAGA